MFSFLGVWASNLFGEAPINQYQVLMMLQDLVLIELHFLKSECTDGNDGTRQNDHDNESTVWAMQWDEVQKERIQEHVHKKNKHNTVVIEDKEDIKTKFISSPPVADPHQLCPWGGRDSTEILSGNIQHQVRSFLTFQLFLPT